MKTLQRAGRLAAVLMLSPLLLLPLGCAVGVGDGYGGNVGIGLDYYEPFGFDYGGWGPGYNIGPPLGGGRTGRGNPGRGGPGRGYRPAPGGHAMPSIPSGGRSGGARPGGGQRR
jgi:hypothetical protein